MVTISLWGVGASDGSSASRVRTIPGVGPDRGDAQAAASSKTLSDISFGRCARFTGSCSSASMALCYL